MSDTTRCGSRVTWPRLLTWVRCTCLCICAFAVVRWGTDPRDFDHYAPYVGRFVVALPLGVLLSMLSLCLAASRVERALALAFLATLVLPAIVLFEYPRAYCLYFVKDGAGAWLKLLHLLAAALAWCFMIGALAVVARRRLRIRRRLLAAGCTALALGALVALALWFPYCRRIYRDPWMLEHLGAEEWDFVKGLDRPWRNLAAGGLNVAVALPLAVLLGMLCDLPGMLRKGVRGNRLPSDEPDDDV